MNQSLLSSGFKIVLFFLLFGEPLVGFAQPYTHDAKVPPEGAGLNDDNDIYINQFNIRPSNSTPSLVGFLAQAHVLTGPFGHCMVQGRLIANKPLQLKTARWNSSSVDHRNSPGYRNFDASRVHWDGSHIFVHHCPPDSESLGTSKLMLQFEYQNGLSTSFISSNYPLSSDFPSPYPFLSPSDNAHVELAENGTVRFEGVLWDFADTVVKLKWRELIGGGEWKEVADIKPSWQGYHWTLDCPVKDQTRLVIALKATDRFGNQYTSAARRVSIEPKNSANPLPVVELKIPDPMIYADAAELPIFGTVKNVGQIDGFSWTLEYTRSKYNLDEPRRQGPTWRKIAPNPLTSELNNALLGVLTIPKSTEWPDSIDGDFQIRLKATNANGSTETFQSVIILDDMWPDWDDDGMSDPWEFETFGTLDQDLNSDFDQDGFSNGDEIRLGLNPTDGQSRWQPIQVSNEKIHLTWMSDNSGTYVIQSSPDLEKGPWTNVKHINSEVSMLQSAELDLPANSKQVFFRWIDAPDPLDGLRVIPLGNNRSIEMAKIPAGSFLMGSPRWEEDRYPWGNNADHNYPLYNSITESPRTLIRIDEPFLMGVTEVTVGQFREYLLDTKDYRGVFTPGDEPPVMTIFFSRGQFMDAENLTPRPVPGKLDADPNQWPIVWVSPEAALSFCRWLTTREQVSGRLPKGYAFTLPTEYQWEYACRAGTTTRFNFGDAPNYKNLQLYGRTCGACNVGEVKDLIPNRWGLHDMHGNAGEWCFYAGDHLPGGSITHSKAPIQSDLFITRGGNAFSPEMGINSRTAARNKPLESTYQMSSIGFRIVLSAE